MEQMSHRVAAADIRGQVSESPLSSVTPRAEEAVQHIARTYSQVDDGAASVIV